MKYLLYRKKGIKGACEGCEDLNIISFRPTPIKLATVGKSVSIKVRFVRLMFFLLTRGKAYILCVKNDHNKIVHTSYVIPKCSKFFFMAKEDWEIGPCITAPESRGQGIYPRVLNYATSHTKDQNTYFYMLVAPDNAPSIRGIEKAGFELFGEAEKYGTFSKYRLVKGKTNE